MGLLPLLFLVISLNGLAQTAASSTGPLTNVRVIHLVQAGLVTRNSHGSYLLRHRSISTSPRRTRINWLQYGVSEETIKLMSARVNGVAPRAPSTQQSQAPISVVTTLLPGPSVNLQVKPAAGALPQQGHFPKMSVCIL